MTGDIAPGLSIATVYFDTPDESFRRLLKSLLQALGHLAQAMTVRPIDLYIVNNSVRRDLTTLLAPELRELAQWPAARFHLIEGQGNVGYGRAHNLALAQTQTQTESHYHLILNPDVELDTAALKSGLQYLESNPKAVLASPGSVDEKGSKQYLCKRYPAAFTLLLRGFSPAWLREQFSERLHRYEMRDLSEQEPSAGIPLCSGCFMLCRTEALKAVEGFCPDYFLYFEDYDLSLRLAAHGELVYLPQMRISHTGGNAARKGRRHIALFLNSARRFYARHGWRWLRQ